MELGKNFTSCYINRVGSHMVFVRILYGKIADIFPQGRFNRK